MGHQGDKDRKKYDRRAGSEYPHAFRRQWPAKKAGRHREERRHARQELLHASEADEDFVITPVYRAPLYKWGTTPLHEVIANTLYKRAARYGWNALERRPYDADRQEQYEAILRGAMASEDRAVAEKFADLLEGMPATLQSALQANPALEAELRAWVARMLA
jgi:hypothetical protein